MNALMCLYKLHNRRALHTTLCLSHLPTGQPKAPMQESVRHGAKVMVASETCQVNPHRIATGVHSTAGIPRNQTGEGSIGIPM